MNNFDHFLHFDMPNMVVSPLEVFLWTNKKRTFSFFLQFFFLIGKISEVCFNMKKNENFRASKTKYIGLCYVWTSVWKSLWKHVKVNCKRLYEKKTQKASLMIFRAFWKNFICGVFSSHGAKIAHNSKNSKLPIITKNLYSTISLQKQVFHDYF